MKKRKILFVLLPLFLIMPLLAQEGSRPKVGLVLSGGGAKGLAHIGVIKVLEEAGIHADIVTGTSMGSIIGALHAIGYSGSDLTRVNLEADWSLLLTNDIPFNRIFLPEKYNYNRFALELPVTSDGFQIPAGLIDGQELSFLFSRLTFRTAGTEKFDDYPLPYRCVAADIVHAKPVLFDSGDLATAMRSSMAIPSVFSPVLIDTNTLLVDGGVFRNFPVQEALDLGADYIIGVYVGFPDKVDVSDLNGLPSILARTTLLSGTKDVAEQTSLVDLLIVPDMENYGTGSFSKGMEIQALGEKAARSILPRLQRLADSLNSLGPSPIRKTLPVSDSVWITDIRIENLKQSRKEFLSKKSGLVPGMWVTPDILEEAIHLASGTLYYEKITYRFESHANGIHLVLNVRERPETYIKAGVHYDNFYSAGIILGISKHNLLFQGTKLNIVGDISSYPQVRADYNKYFGERHNFYASLYSSADISSLPVYEDKSRVGYARDNFLKAGLSVNYIIKTNNRIGVAAQYRLSNLQPDDALKIIYPIFTFDKVGFHAADLGLEYEHNTLNNNLYPVRGSHAFLKMNYIFTGEEFLMHGIIDSTEIGDIRLDASPFWKIHGGFQNFLPISAKLSFHSGLNFGFSAEETALTDIYYLGGHQFNLRRNQVSFLGLEPNQLTAYNFIKLNAGLQHETVPGLFMGINCNYMHTSDFFNQLFDQLFSSWGDKDHFGLGGGITYKSPLGPLSLWFASQVNEFTPSWYINFGFTF